MKKYFYPLILAAALLTAACGGSDDEPLPDVPEEPVETPEDPDEKEGMTVRGRVLSKEGPVGGVCVSDGVNIAVTDADGAYWLASDKENGYVFISVPSGYEAQMDSNHPLFWQALTKGATTPEVVNFTVSKCDQSKVALVAFADFHLAKRTDDLAQFNKFCSDANSTARKLREEGYAVYGVSLGDESWDLYWYSNHYSFGNAYTDIDRLDMPFFHNMGNHDNNPYVADDHGAENSFRRTAGPTFYSFNAGDAHVVILDDIVYENIGGAQGNIGDRSYKNAFADDILAWLKKDLATVADKSKPLVLGMHAPVYKTARAAYGDPVVSLKNGSGFLDLLAPFTNVSILSGHIHENCNTPLPSGNGMEHNIGAVCGTWWWTGQMAGVHICKDGTPGGYAVFRFEGSGKPQWYYKGSSFDRDYQFRTIDLNTAWVNPDEYVSKDLLAQHSNGLDKKPAQDNRVLINVFNYDPEWKVSVTENGKELPVTRVAGKDLYHTLVYNCKRIGKGVAPNSTFQTSTTAHLFEVKASSPSSTLVVKVTDRFGKVYTEEMTRPKAFNEKMK